MKYGWEICDEVERHVDNAADAQWVPKASFTEAMEIIQSIYEDEYFEELYPRNQTCVKEFLQKFNRLKGE